MDSRDPHAIVTLHIPPAALCGVDLVSFSTTAQFQGIKHVTAGWHFIYTSLTPSLSIRHGTWVNIPLQNTSRATKLGSSGSDAVIIIKKWDAQREELVDEKDEAVINRLKGNAATIWRERLTPYRSLLGGSPGTGGAIDDAAVKEKLRDWHVLTDCISPELLSRVTGGQSNNWRLSSASSAARDVDEIPGLSSDLAGDDDARVQAGGRGGELHFLPIDLKRTWRAGAIGRERTEAAQDRSWALGDLIRHHCAVTGTGTAIDEDQESHGKQKQQDTQQESTTDDDDEEEAKEKYILGEMQLTFLMILTLANYSCMEQWKRLLTLLLTCRVAIGERARLFSRTLHLLEVQLRHSNDVEGGLFDMGAEDDEGGGSPLLKKLLKTFRRKLEDLLSTTEQATPPSPSAPGAGETPLDAGNATMDPAPDPDPDPDPDPGPRSGPHPAPVLGGTKGKETPKQGLAHVQRAFRQLESFLRDEFGWELGDAYVRRGMVQLEDGEEVEVEVDDLQGEDERGEYAPVVVDLDEP